MRAVSSACEIPHAHCLLSGYKSASQMLGLGNPPIRGLSFPFNSNMPHNQTSSCSYSEAVTQIQVQASILLRKTACASLLGEGAVYPPLSPSKPNLGDIVYKGYIISFINSTHNCLISFLLIHYGDALNVIFFLSIYT